MSGPSGSSSPFNLEFLRKDAKRLLRAAQAGDVAALARLRVVLGRASQSDNATLRSALKLADAQQAIAREHGHANWADLTRHDNPLERFLVAVRGGAQRQIVQHLPEFAPLASASIHAACALGDGVALERHLARDPAAATAPHRDWPPLAYVCASPLNRLSVRHSAGLLECARTLLDLGVDPHGLISQQDIPLLQPAVPILVRALMNANVPISLLLQQRGVSMQGVAPYMLTASKDSSMFSDVFREYFSRADVRDKMKALMAETRTSFGSVADYGRSLDPRSMHAPKGPGLPGMQHDVWNSLLDRGYDATGRTPNGQTILHTVARTGQADLVDLIIGKGADPNLRDAEGHSVIAAAMRAGHQDVVDVLRRHGAVEDDVSTIDRLVSACARLDADAARSLVTAEPRIIRRLLPEDHDALIRAVTDGRADRLALMLDVGFPPSGRGESGATALHFAAWLGHGAMVHLLLDHGAPTDIRDTTYGQSPEEWAAHGAIHCRDAADEYAAIISALAGPPT